MISNLCFVLALLACVQFQATVEGTPVTESKKDFKIICHYHLNSWYAPDSRDYQPEVIDESQCTHIVYNDRVQYTDLSANRSLHDGKKLFYDRVPQFRKKGINVSISFFKFDGYEYAKILRDENRTEFVDILVGFMERNQFNGFDFFWSCRSCSKGDSRNASDDAYFMDLVSELSKAFKPRGWFLSTFVSVNEDVVNSAFDVQKFSEYVDWMTYYPINLRQRRNTITTLMTPLYFYPGDVQPDSTSNFSINYFIEKGVPPQKLVLSISSRGQNYRLQSAENNGLNAPAEQQYSGNFYEICEKVAKHAQWNVVHDTDKRIGTYAYNEQEWIAYNDVEDVQHKAEFIIQNNLGGGSISSSNYDDFEGKCGCGKSPLQRALTQALRNDAGPKLVNCT